MVREPDSELEVFKRAFKEGAGLGATVGVLVRGMVVMFLLVFLLEGTCFGFKWKPKGHQP